MARVELIEARLRTWAQWVKTGDGSGYPTKCTLHPEWSPPAPGTTPTMKTGAPSDARQTHRAIDTLSLRLKNTVVLHYVHNLQAAEIAVQLQCEPGTIYPRIYRAHRLLAVALNAGGFTEYEKSLHFRQIAPGST